MHCKRLYPIFSTYVNDIMDVTRASIEYIDLSVVAATDNGASSIVEGHISRSQFPTWNLEGFQPF